MGRKFLASVLALAFVSLAPTVAYALPLDSFECITDNLAGDCALGTAQLSGSVVQVILGQAKLTIENVGADDLVVANVYLESSLLTGLRTVSTPGTSFSVGGAPRVLPGAVPFFSIDALAVAVPPPTVQGINPGESAEFLIDYPIDSSFEELVGGLRVGVHVIAYESEGSESLITVPIPEPGSGALLLLALAAVARIARRRSRPVDRGAPV